MYFGFGIFFRGLNFLWNDEWNTGPLTASGINGLLHFAILHICEFFQDHGERRKNRAIRRELIRAQ